MNIRNILPFLLLSGGLLACAEESGEISTGPTQPQLTGTGNPADNAENNVESSFDTESSLRTESDGTDERTENDGTNQDTANQEDSTTPQQDSGNDESNADVSGESPECDPEIPVLKAPYFTDISEQSGIQKDNYVSMPGNNIPINDHSRLAFADLNGDGLDDIVMHSLFPNAQAGIPFEHLIFLNNGDGTFEDFSDESGLRHYQVGFFAFGDLDNDGDQDIFGGLDIALGSPHEVLLNDGSGRFTAVQNSGFANEWNTTAGTALLADFNGDAVLDLFIGNGQTSSAAPDSFWFGNGDGTFQKATSALAGSFMHPSNGSVACDYDNDGDLDIFVSTYGVSAAKGHNILWENQGENFINVAAERGFHALEGGNYWLATTGFGKDAEGVPKAEWMGSNGFGIACEDINGDGFLDIYLATISHPVDGDYSRKWSDPSQVLINQGPEGNYSFENQFQELGLPFNEGDIDAAAIDFDNDGRMDLAVTRDSKYEKGYADLEQKSWFGLFLQGEDGTFESTLEVGGINELDFVFEASLSPCVTTEECPGTEICFNEKCRTPCSSNAECPAKSEICHKNGFCKGLAKMKKGQNQAWADIDRDGDLDLLVGGRDNGGGRPNFLFENNVGNTRRWLGIHLEGDGIAVNRDAIGAKVTIVWDEGQILRTVQGSRGTYNSADGRALLLGLGKAPCSYTINIQWPDGTAATFGPGSLEERNYHKIAYPNVVVAPGGTP